ncbi:universal stress protein [Streptomyces sp. NPDC020681]|uniref:universal stress protein n=1 Tax=Streptomyces sp. NPDC020681 TaxID=3365083 RepID=UPI0037933D59
MVAGIDGSARSCAAADWAALEAARRGLPLWVVHVSCHAPEEVADRWPYRPVPLPDCFVQETSVEDRADVAENGDQYQLMIEALANDPRSRLLRVRIDDVSFTSDLQATIRYILFSDGKKVGPEGPGVSVLQGDTWKISFKTVCSRTKYGKDTPQAATC